jgi:hypothetical protein
MCDIINAIARVLRLACSQDDQPSPSYPRSRAGALSGQPSAVVLHNQNVKSTEARGPRGCDGGKSK